MADLEPIPYSDQKIRHILENVHTIAMVCASSNWNRPSYFVMKYLQGKGYRVIPVNPGIAGQTLLGETVYDSLKDIPDKIDMVDMFRAADAAFMTNSLRLIALRYQAGESTAFELVDAQNTLVQARNAADDAAARYRVALAELQTLTGPF